MTPVIFFLIMAVASLAVHHFLGSPDPSKLNRWDLITAPIFNIALTGLVISILYQVVIFLKGMHP